MKFPPILVSVFLVAVPRSEGAVDVDPAGAAFFESRIRPVLSQQCQKCHATGAKKIGGKLLLDSREALLRGGESGPAVVPGKPEESLLIAAMRWEHDLEMPPEEPLPDPVIEDFVRWVRMGAPDPRDGTAAERPGTGAPLWSTLPVVAPPLPVVQDTVWTRDPMDRFVLAGLEQRGFRPSVGAAPEALIRRLYFDLTGLPPDAGEIEAFAADHQREGPEAVVRLVDRLLASPRFGERWGRHWLDVARYGESNGNDGLSRNPTFPHAWRYRDYVIDSFNRDVPYDRFVTEQIAGDLLEAESASGRDRQLVATGFLALGAKPAKAMNTNFDMDVVADQIDVVTRGFLGISVACARCHDHKSDPVPTRDYYALAGIFTSTQTLWGAAGHEPLTAPATDLHLLEAAPRVPPPDGFVETVLVIESDTGKPKPPPKSKWPVGTPLAMGVRDREKPADGKIHLKGESSKLGEEVPRGFLGAWKTGTEETVGPAGSGRLELARWIASPRHPLTARVMVNRIWQHLFGEGIVRTPDDFGFYGEPPTHPELLDHLAMRFIDGGWSVKGLVRDIVLSRTYQLSCDADPELIASDPENRWLGRHRRRLLDAESLRDAMLAASGQLDLTPPEGSIIRHRDILVNLAGDLHQPSRHRSVYLCYLRGSPPPELAPFNLPEFTAVTGKRAGSILPTQALYLFNGPFVVEQADHLASLILAENGTEDDAGRVRSAYRRALRRSPDAAEVVRAIAFVRETRSRGASLERSWSGFCHALLASNEFRYVD